MKAGPLRLLSEGHRCTRGSGLSATDLQLSPDYVYPSGKHTDSFNLSAELAMSLADNGTEDQLPWDWIGFGPWSFHPRQLNTQPNIVIVCPYSRSSMKSLKITEDFFQNMLQLQLPWDWIGFGPW
jgi:hypothetical protein